MGNILTDKGKKLSWLLRHDKDAFDSGFIDKNGWRSVKVLCKVYGYTP